MDHGYPENPSKGSGEGNGGQMLQTVLNADREAFLQEHGRRKNGY